MQADEKGKVWGFKKDERRLNPDEKALRTSLFDSDRMGRIRQQHTKPELIVRRIVSSHGHRYRTSNKDLPGSPDLANRKRRWAIFVHGCYWHHHEGCPKATVPKANRDYWLAKFERNRERDRQVEHELHRLGFRVIVVWECEANKPELLERRLRSLGRLKTESERV
ncbi:MAG: DNA mismatch endonuclease Vsr [Xanthomonadales bacterium]|nr:DNA mismatch endonuclease Vsr [Xanthomonadales bacterium]